MKAIWNLAVLAVLALAAPLTGAHAQGAQPVELKGEVKLDKLVTEEGKSRHELVAPEVVVPGDHLVFSTSYRNTSAETIKDFVVTNPLPAGVMLASDDAASLDVSVDGGKTWGKLAQLSVAPENGAARPAQPSDVTHIRWTIPAIKPGQQGTLTYLAIVR